MPNDENDELDDEFDDELEDEDDLEDEDEDEEDLEEEDEADEPSPTATGKITPEQARLAKEQLAGNRNAPAGAVPPRAQMGAPGQATRPPTPPVQTKGGPAPAGQKSLQVKLQDGPVNAGQVPMTMAVELGRVTISAETLLDMQKGHLLELDPNSQNQVDLVMNGKVVAKGELVKIGEVIGVRVLQIG